jgi:hypothetical protein
LLRLAVMMLRLAYFTLALALVACGDDEPANPDAAQTRDADTTTPDAPPGTPDAATSPDAMGTGAACGGFADQGCEEGLFCDWAEDGCGGDDSQGVCTVRPTECTEEYQPVCGCDGNVYSNTCTAQAAGTDVSIWGGCDAPGGYFKCGPNFCAVDLTYCEIVISDVVGIPNEYACKAVPAACGDVPSCECLEEQPCGAFCEQTGDGYTLTCPGG